MYQNIFFSMLFFTSFGYGFINVEPPVIGEKEGIDAEVSLSSDYRSGNSDKSAIGTSGKGQYNSQEWLLYFIYGYSYGESNGQKDTSDGMLHLRYVHTLTDELYDYELFCQTEFNAFQDIRIRNLAGSNLRRKLDTGFDNSTPYENIEKSDFRSTVNLRYKLK